MSDLNSGDCEYIVVGSGAGGGTVAARLAEEGCRVTLLEAGGDPRTMTGGDAIDPATNRLPEDYDVPAFHAFASENSAIKWDFFVRHYADQNAQRLDPNYLADRDGVLYPRAAALGGCTAHNAMILVYPHNADWDYIAELTGDRSWEAARMRRYFQRLERCRHRPLERWLAFLGYNPTRHGWRGWLSTELGLPTNLLESASLDDAIATGAIEALKESGHEAEHLRWALEGALDPNDWRMVRENATGIRYLPLTTSAHARTGSRERVLDVANRFPDRLQIVTHALVTRVLFDQNNRATGVEYLQGERLYRAHANPAPEGGEVRTISASREVILSGGAFNTPQLLMLSGIGPRDELARHGIASRADLRGVGKNLQDRYEIGVVNHMNFQSWAAYRGSTFSSSDPQSKMWRTSRSGLYISNGSVLTLFRKSPVASDVPDLFCMSLLARFSGYAPGYSRAFAEKKNYLTWVVLKAHTKNRSGEVTLRSSDPRDPPLINFNYFKDGAADDLKAVVDGIRFVRKLTSKLKDQGLIAQEELPGCALESDEELEEFVRQNAWGHHASCSCPIGAADQGGVLSHDFRVHGVSGLRVVDASVFPKIPGFFIASAIYMIGEKAADVILESRKQGAFK